MKSSFMKTSFADGTVKTKLHEKWINIKSVSFGIVSNGLHDLTLSGLKHHANFSSINITKLSDRSSLGLIAASCEGKIDSSDVKIDVGKMHDQDMMVTKTYILKKAYIQSFNQIESSTGEELDQFVMGFSSIHITITEYDEKGQAFNKIDYDHKTENSI